MAVSSPALSDALRDVVGREHLISEPPALAAAAIDGLTPRWVARPGSAEDVSRLLALASSERLAVTPRGSGSTLDLGNPPRRVDLVLDTRRLARVTDYVPEDMVATVEAGTTLGTLAGELSRQGQRLALDPPRGPSRTIGGVLATRASGPLRFRFGTGRDLLLGVRFVQADGTITWGGSRVVKSVTGYDVPKLLVGSLGTLGVIVGATLRLHPVPAATGSWLCSFESAERGAGFLGALLASSLEPERVVVVNRSARLAAGLADSTAGRGSVSGSAPSILLSVGSVEEAVASQGQALADLTRREGGHVAPLPPSLWQRLDVALEAPVVLQLAGEIRRTMAWLARAEALAAASGWDVACVGQAGSGVLDLAVGGPASGGELDARMLRPLRDELRSEGGTVVVQRAPRAFKVDLDAWGPVPADALAIMKRIKDEFDPAGILNPGRFAGGL
jgi:glycolate oxidase FAD binding subunit